MMAMLPYGHELASLEKVALAELLAVPLISCKADRLPCLLQQMRTIVRLYTLTLTVASEDSSLTGYVTRVAAGIGADPRLVLCHGSSRKSTELIRQSSINSPFD